MPGLPPTVGDSEFWLLAKRVAQGGGQTLSGDTVFSLQSKLTEMVSSGEVTVGGGQGISEAPTDGNLYGRQDTDWTMIPAIPTAVLTITTIQPNSAVENTSVQITVTGAKFTIASVINWGGYPIPTTLVNDTTLQGALNLGPGSSGIYTVVVTDGNALSNSVAFAVTPSATIFAQSGAACALNINADGDLIITQSQGPNAGKSVNLTYSKWA